MKTASRRTLRGVNADFENARRLMIKSAVMGGNIIWFAGARAVFVGWAELGGPQNTQRLIIASIIAMVLLVLMCRWLYAGIALTVWCLAIAVWVATVSGSPFYVIYALAIGACAAFGTWNRWQFPTLEREYAELWTPHLIQTGEVYTVRDGSSFSVVKVLAVEPNRVHVKQYALRYPERPFQVKSSTLLNATANGKGKGFDHLPLDFEEFIRWDPVLLRSEPLTPGELKPLETWQRLQATDQLTP